MLECLASVVHKLCGKEEAAEAECNCPSSCCGTVVICRSDSEELNRCLPGHARLSTERSGQYAVDAGDPGDVPHSVSFWQRRVATANAALAKLRRDYK